MAVDETPRIGRLMQPSSCRMVKRSFLIMRETIGKIYLLLLMIFSVSSGAIACTISRALMSLLKAAMTGILIRSPRSIHPRSNVMAGVILDSKRYATNTNTLSW